MKNEKNYMAFLITKTWQILKHFPRALSWAQTSYFWRVGGARALTQKRSLLIQLFSFQYGDTPLHTGARYGHAGVIRILVSADCNPSEQNKVIIFSFGVESVLKKFRQNIFFRNSPKTREIKFKLKSFEFWSVQIAILQNRIR